MRFIELFAGIGGFRLGLEKAGHECVYVNEWEDKPASIYEKVFNDEPDRRDIRLISGGELPEADLIVGGFPCATFSVAGKKSGFCLSDARGSLCFEMFRVASERGIPYILFENVKGLLNHDFGRTFAVILCSLDELGYDCQWELLDSQNFGVPQHRERIFLVASLRGKPRPKVFPITIPTGQDGSKGADKHSGGEGIQAQICGTLDAHYTKGGSSRTSVKQWRRGYFRDYKAEGTPTLTANMGTGGHNVPFVQATLTPAREKRQQGRRRKEHNEPAFTVGVVDRHGVTITDKGESTVRKLTPLECERLQGLPDDHTKYYRDGSLVSDSQRYERCGRTVTVPVIKAIGEGLNEFF